MLVGEFQCETSHWEEAQGHSIPLRPSTPPRPEQAVCKRRSVEAQGERIQGHRQVKCKAKAPK